MRRRKVKALLLCVAGLFLVNSAATRLPASQTRFVAENNGEPDLHTVVIAGMKADADLQTRQIRSELNADSNTTTVVYDPKHFDKQEVAQQLADYLRSLPSDSWNREELRIFGSSLGAHVGMQLIDVIEKTWEHAPTFSFIAVDSPGDASDLAQKTLARITLAFWPGIIENTAQRLFSSKTVPDYPHDGDSDAAIRMANNAASHHYPISGITDQGRALVLQAAPASGKYRHVDFVLLRSEEDEEVLPSASKKMLDAFGVESERLLIVPGTQHTSFAEHPGRWREGIRKALALLGQRSA